MQNFQLSLFYNLQAFVLASSFYRKYYLIFSGLNLKGIPNKTYRVGRKPYCRHAMIKAFIIKHLEELKSIPKLIEFLDAHPVLTEMCGFKMGALPDETQFYRFLKKTPNSFLQTIHTEVNRELFKKGALSLDTFLIDSKPVMAATKENNFKNPKCNSNDKSKNQNEILVQPYPTIPINNYLGKRTLSSSGAIEPMSSSQKRVSPLLRKPCPIIKPMPRLPKNS